MAWVSLILAGVCEAFGVLAINRFNKISNLQSLLLLLSWFGASFLFLAYAMKFLPMGTAYAVWTGLGASGGTIFGVIFYGESKDWRRILCIAAILGSAIGLKLIS